MKENIEQKTKMELNAVKQNPNDLRCIPVTLLPGDMLRSSRFLETIVNIIISFWEQSKGVECRQIQASKSCRRYCADNVQSISIKKISKQVEILHMNEA